MMSEEVICYINHTSDTSIHHVRYKGLGGLHKMTLDEQKGSK